MPSHFCSFCGAACDSADNFCRRCGKSLSRNLPVLAPARAPVRKQFLPAPLVGSVAVLAVGTGMEWLARRLAGNAARAAGKALIGMSGQRTPGVSSESTTVDEVLYVRKIQLRR